MQFEVIQNMASGATGGAGIQAAQTIASKGAKVLITGNVGPNAFQALSAAGIKIVTGAFGTVREVIEKYKRGELRETDAPTVGGHFGMGRGRGRGRGQWGT
jgi:predicted Fe-Mo cluster-binding NifX family protein